MFTKWCDSLLLRWTDLSEQGGLMTRHALSSFRTITCLQDYGFAVPNCNISVSSQLLKYDAREIKYYTN